MNWNFWTPTIFYACKMWPMKMWPLFGFAEEFCMNKSSNKANATEFRRMRCHIIYGWCVSNASEMNVLDALFVSKFGFRSICCCCPNNMVCFSSFAVSFPFLLLLIFCHLDAVHPIQWCAHLKAFRFLYHRIFFNCRCLCKLWIVDKICKTMS